MSDHSCAFCGRQIEVVGFDPCLVSVEARPVRDGEARMWEFWVHARCVPNAMEPMLRDAVATEYEYPAT